MLAQELKILQVTSIIIILLTNNKFVRLCGLTIYTSRFVVTLKTVFQVSSLQQCNDRAEMFRDYFVRRR